MAPVPSDTVKRVIWSAILAFLAGFLTLAPGLAAAPNLSNARAALVAAVVAGLSAGLSALKNAILVPGHRLR